MEKKLRYYINKKFRGGFYEKIKWDLIAYISLFKKLYMATKSKRNFIKNWKRSKHLGRKKQKKELSRITMSCPLMCQKSSIKYTTKHWKNLGVEIGKNKSRFFKR